MKTVHRTTAVALSRALVKMIEAGYALDRVYQDDISDVRDYVADSIVASAKEITTFAETVRGR